MIHDLSKSFPSRGGVPVISGVDTSIFELKYFTHCSQCHFCHDWCCSFGAELDLQNVKRIEAEAEGLQHLVPAPRAEWFDNEVEEDSEYVGGKYMGTNVINGACVFLNRSNRGCLLQTYSIQQGFDYHEIKPMICVIYPLTFSEGVLLPADEIEDKSLVCMGSGPSLYRGVRNELAYYFGNDLVKELDEVERTSSRRAAGATGCD